RPLTSYIPNLLADRLVSCRQSRISSLLTGRQVGYSRGRKTMKGIAEPALTGREAGAFPHPATAPHAEHRADARPGARSRTDARARIQQVAVELFTEHGYEGTSLREIAERLSVTKAALYYHFKSKEDIIQSLAEDYQAQTDDLIAWARSQPR